MQGSIELPLKPYLHKFLHKKLNIKNNEIDISYTDPIAFGILVSYALSKKRSFVLNNNPEEVGNFIDKCTSSVNLNLKSYHINKTGFILTEDAIFYINKYLDKLFRNEIFVFINSQIMYYPHLVITVAIDDFFSIFSINESDLSKQTICKIYQREKRSRAYLKSV